MAEGKPTQAERLAGLESGLLVLADKVDRLVQRMDKQEVLIDSVNKLAHSIEIMANDIKYTNQKIDDIACRQKATDGKVETLMLSPGKKWDTVSLFVITSIVAAVVGMVAGKLF